jgi:hypothetical protein
METLKNHYQEREVETIVNSIYKRQKAKTKGTVVTEGTVAHKKIFPDAELFPSGAFPFDAFPKDLITLNNRISDALHVEPELVACAALPIISGAIGNSVRISPREGWTVPPFIWQIIIAISGYGKSPVINLLLKHPQDLQAEHYKDYQTRLRGYEAALHKANREADVIVPEKPRLRHYLVSDTTVEALANVFNDDPRGVVLHKDELSGLISGLNQYRSGKGNDLQHYLELFDATPWKIDRKTGVIFVPNTGASIIGGIQPRVMSKAFDIDAFNDGLLPRFLLLNSETKPLKFSRQGITERELSYWYSLLDNCYALPLEIVKSDFVKPIILILNQGALDLFERFHNDLGEIEPFLSDQTKIFIPKLITYCLKFCGILHVIKSFSKSNFTSTIEEETTDSAIKMTKFFAGQVIQTMKLYNRPTACITEFDKLLIETLYNLQEEVKSGKLILARIGEVYNCKLPDRLKQTPEAVSSMLSGMGLRTQKSTNNLSHLIWEKEKIDKLFSMLTVTSVTDYQLQGKASGVSAWN